MDTDAHGSVLVAKEGTHAIIGAAFKVLNELGHGLHEKPYENALIVESGLRGRRADQQQRFPVVYKGVQVSEYVPDLLVGSAVVVDAKVIERIADHERGQRLNYRRITGRKVGLNLNFRKPKLEWERTVL